MRKTSTRTGTGDNPPVVIGERNRCRCNAGYLALFYHPDLPIRRSSKSPKRANIYLSLTLLVVLGVIFFRELGGLAATNPDRGPRVRHLCFQSGVRAVGAALLLSDVRDISRLLASAPVARGWRAIVVAAGTGAVAGLAQLTKAAMLPFVGIFLAVYLWALARGLTHPSNGVDRSYAKARSRLAAAIVFAAAFFIVFVAILVDQQARVRSLFLQREQHVLCLVRRLGTTRASGRTRTVTALAGRPWPNRSCQVAGRFLRQHTAGQIASRMASGFADMAIKSVQM
jgi:hypothetical protein